MMRHLSHRELLRTSIALGPLLCGMLTLSAGGVRAQESGPGASATQVEAITVTALKRDTSLKEATAAITAIPRQAVELKQIKSATDLNTLVPNLNVTTNSSLTYITIRGISTSSPLGAGESSVATYVNGVYQPRTGNLDYAFNDLNSIEVLRGPQGTLFGRNATAGAISLTTNQPTRDWQASLTGLYGSYDRSLFKGYISGPISDTLSFRLFASDDDQRRGYGTDLVTHQDIDRTHTSSVTGALLWEPSPKFKLTVSAYSQNLIGAYAFHVFSGPTGPLTSLLGVPFNTSGDYTLATRDVRQDESHNNSQRNAGVSATAVWTPLPNVTVKSVSGYVQGSWHLATDGDGWNDPILVGFNISYKYKTFTEDFTVDSKFLGDKLDVLLGGFFLTDRFDTNYQIGLNFLTYPLPLGTNLGPAFGNLSTPLYTKQIYGQTTTSYAGFADATYKVTNRFKIYGGLRASSDEKAAQVQFLAIFPSCGFGLPVANESHTWNSVSPRAGLQYDVSSDVTVYGQWQRAEKPGGYNTTSCNNEFNPEKITAYEVGVKANILGGRGFINLAGYYYDYTNLQVDQITSLTIVTENAASATIKGLELEGGVSLTDWLRWDLAATAQDAEFNHYNSCDALLFTTTAVPDGVNCTLPPPLMNIPTNLAGHQMPFAPHFTARTGLTYKHEFGFGKVTLAGEVAWTDGVELTPFGFLDPAERQGPYAIENLYLTYAPIKSRLLVEVFVKNLGDKTYRSFSLPDAGTCACVLGTYAPPRTIGVQATYRFF
ncbi:MAG: hypothetical protein JWO83_1551 [Caulobacteraceae bacterium]|nr:hypothetical protein [Caulobacteraceae bacterium]